MESVSCVSDGSDAASIDWGLIATTCEFLAFSFRYPDSAAVLPVVTGEWLDALCELRRIWGFSEDAERDELMQLCGKEADSVLHDLRQEATRLFIGPPLPVASPYESVWVASRVHAVPLLFVSPSAIAVEHFCANCGLGRPAGTNEALDHVASELELLQFLACVQSGAVDTSSFGTSQDAFPGGSAAAAFGSFFDEHISKWVHGFATKVEQSSIHVFYRASARFLRDFVLACEGA